MGKFQDLTGMKFGKLTVVKKGEPHITSGGRKLVTWICECDCGKIISASAQNLRSGKVKSCGCLQSPDLTGKKFGMLTVISESEPKYGERFWKCVCDCGNETMVRGTTLMCGRTMSCGCLRHNSPPNYVDLTGKRFGRLVVLERSVINGNRKICKSGAMWRCLCDCGNIKDIPSGELTSGRTKSCGCLKHDMMSTHEKSNTKIYKIYKGIISRCYCKTATGYKNYGGRGITVCDEWLGEHGFENFYEWSMNNGYYDGLSIDRINVNGNYEPSNCRWITMKQQLRNTRRCIQITYNGETHNLSEWAEILNMDYSLLNSRISKQKWSVEKAFTTPVLNSRNDNGEH